MGLGVRALLHTPDMPEHSTKDPSASTELDSTCVHKKMLVELIKKTDGGFARVSRRKCVRGTPPPRGPAARDTGGPRLLAPGHLTKAERQRDICFVGFLSYFWTKNSANFKKQPQK